MRINPQNIVSLLHNGGRGGHFLAGCINQHNGFINRLACPLENNTYNIDVQDIIFDQNLNCNLRLCIPSHSVTSDFAQSIIKLESSRHYDIFYHALFWLKTGGPGFNIISMQRYNKIVEPSFMLNKWLPESHLDFCLNTTFMHRINLDQLFFGSTENEYQTLCAVLDITPIESMANIIQNYHQANVNLIIKNFGVVPEELCNLQLDQQIDLFIQVLSKKICA